MMKDPDNLELENAVIEYADIRNDDHGLLTAWIGLKYKGGAQGFGGHALYLPASFTRHELQSLAGHFIWRVMEIAGAGEWAKLRGKTIRARHNSGQVWEIGHIINDDWFCPARDFAPVTERGGEDFWVDLIARSERLSERHEWFVGRVREMRKAAERAVDKYVKTREGEEA